MKKDIENILQEAIKENDKILERLAYIEELERKARIYDELEQTWKAIVDNGYQKILFLEICNHVFNK